MKNKIKLLPDSLINQIAAGEVVERPASVVKEVIENSLDAGSTRLVIELENGGKKLIRVVDDGEGMSRDDALLALERHATSKIQTRQDLFAISTLGFRGEALPSVAAVSHLELVTRTRDMEAAVIVRTEGGVIKDVSEVGAPFGTSISVKNLFFNVPARKKFLKTLDTELGHISDNVSRIALSNPGVHFELYHNGGKLLLAPAGQNLLDRLRHALGASAADQLIPVEKEIPGLLREGGLTIRGYLSRPSFTRSTTRYLFVFINGRFVKDKVINHAVIESYRTLMPKGRYPVIALFIEMPHESVDVNVHPAKSEVRFHEPVKIHEAVAGVIVDVLKKGDRTGREYHPPEEKSAEYRHRVASAIERYGRRAASTKEEQKPPPARSAPAGPPRQSRPVPPPGFKPHDAPPPGPGPETEEIKQPDGFFSGLAPIGQLKGMYLLCESEGELVIIDQHAAAERVAFERLKKQYHSREVLRQALLFPQTIELNLREAKTLEANLDRMEEIGLEVEPFGQNAFILKAVPSLITGADYSQLILDVLEELASLGRTAPLEEKLDDIFAVLSCHAVIRGSHTLSNKEIKALLESLDTIEFPSHCPHGRNVITRISLREIEKMFGR